MAHGLELHWGVYTLITALLTLRAASQSGGCMFCCITNCGIEQLLHNCSSTRWCCDLKNQNAVVGVETSAYCCSDKSSFSFCGLEHNVMDLLLRMCSGEGQDPTGQAGGSANGEHTENSSKTEQAESPTTSSTKDHTSSVVDHTSCTTNPPSASTDHTPSTTNYTSSITDHTSSTTNPTSSAKDPTPSIIYHTSSTKNWISFSVSLSHFKGLQFVANSNRISFNSSEIPNPVVSVFVPGDLFIRQDHNISNVTFIISASTCTQLNLTQIFQDNFCLGIEVENMTISNMSTPFRINFLNSKGQNGSCVFQNNNELEHTGCTTDLNSTITCSCNHFTYFALLLVGQGHMYCGGNAVLIGSTVVAIGLLNPSLVENKPLDIFTYISCGISVALFTATLVLHALKHKNQKTDQTMMVHLQLVGSLLLLNFAFLINGTLSSQASMPWCTVLGILVHYLLLCSFTSLALEGAHLLRLLARVYNVHMRHYFVKMSLLIWGAPALVILIILARHHWDAYGWTNPETKSTCWITNDVVRYVTVLGYLAVVMLFNTAIFTFVVVKMVLLQARLTAHQKGNYWRNICSLFLITYLLGFSWILGFFLQTNPQYPIIVMFTVLNSLQGFAVGLWLFFKRCSSAATDTINTAGTTSVPHNRRTPHSTEL